MTLESRTEVHDEGGRLTFSYFFEAFILVQRHSDCYFYALGWDRREEWIVGLLKASRMIEWEERKAKEC